MIEGLTLLQSNEKLQQHAQCMVRYKDQNLQQNLQGDASITKEKIRTLRNGIADGITARYNRPMMARAIRSLARFSEDYQSIDELVMSSSTLEATSHVSFGSVKEQGTYHTHPAIIESLTQSCGYIMNCNDENDLDLNVYMIHGWQTLQIFEAMDLEKRYITYTSVSEGPNKVWHGDVIVFEGEKVVAHLGQVTVRAHL